MHTKEYYELIDKEVKLIPLTFDVNFKAIMLKNTNLFLYVS